jgi:hypothetical protein
MNSDMGQGNLAGEMINEMQKINSPGVFNPEGQMNGQMGQMGSVGQMGQSGQMGQMGQMGQQMGQMGQQMGQSGQMGQMGQMGQSVQMGQPGQMGQNGGQGGNQPVQINPQLQQQFLFVLQQDQQLQQKFADQQLYQQALQDPTIMMNTIAYYDQKLKSQPPQPQQPVQEDDVYDHDAHDNDNDEEDEEDNDKRAQYDDKIDDIDMLTTKKSLVDKLISHVKEPILMTIVFLVLTQPFVRNYLIKMIPKIQDFPIVQTVMIGLIFFCVTYAIKLTLSYF